MEAQEGFPKRMVFQVCILTTSCPAGDLLGACPLPCSSHAKYQPGSGDAMNKTDIVPNLSASGDQREER